MGKKVFILISFGFLCTLSLLAQCPNKDSIWKKIGLFRSSPTFSSAEKLSVLLKYESEMKNCPYRYDSTHVFLLRTIGAIYYSEADFIKAVKYIQQAIDILTQNANKPSVNIRQLPGNYYWLSRFYDSLNMVGEKMKALDSCAKIAIRLKSIDRASLWALYARLEYFYDRGDYQRCIDYATMCVALGSEYSRIEESVGKHYASSSLVWHVNALLELKNYEAAENLLANKAGEYRKAGANYILGVIYQQLAQVEIGRGNYNKSLLYFNDAFTYERKAGYDVNCRTILKDIGHDVYFKSFNNINKAFVYYKKALAYVNKDTSQNKINAIETLSILNNIANVYVIRGVYDSAHKYFQLAFDQIKPGAREQDLLYSSLEEFPMQKRIGYIATLLIDKGNAFRQQYTTTGQLNNLREAVRIYKVADQFLDRMKTAQSDLKSKLFWRSQSRRLYENAIQACYAYGNVSDAFYFFEKSRAVLLMDQLNEQHWLNEEDILRQTQVKKRILQLENEYGSADKSSSRYRELQDERFEAKQELDRLIQDIKERNPLYYQSFLDSNVITLNDIQRNILLDHDAVVEIFNGDSAVYVLVVTAAHAKLSQVNKGGFDSLSRQYISHISNSDMLNRNYNQFVNLSRNLFQLIFENNSVPKGRIIISPEGQYFPFEALVTGTQPVTYFLKDHSLSYTYSARYLMNQFTASSGSIVSRNFMGLAPVQYPGYLHLAALKGSDRSLSQIRSYFSNADNLVAAEASKNNFLQQFYKYKIIQLYSHASDSSSTGEPVIWFADSTLYLSDLIPDHQPVTSLIVLSACETGMGQLYQGEGVFNFNRGFAALGIPSAITNLWSVDNVSTYHLTELFYKHLAQGLPIDISLQKAKLEFIKDSPKEKSLPYYWAATILAGKTDAIELKKDFPWKSLAFLMALGGGLSFFGYRLWIRRKKISNRISKMMHADAMSSKKE
jgi:CHAT domain-containing protein